MGEKHNTRWTSGISTFVVVVSAMEWIHKYRAWAEFWLPFFFAVYFGIYTVLLLNDGISVIIHPRPKLFMIMYVVTSCLVMSLHKLMSSQIYFQGFVSSGYGVNGLGGHVSILMSFLLLVCSFKLTCLIYIYRTLVQHQVRWVKYHRTKVACLVDQWLQISFQ